jgi:DNA-binding MarR family transcriptional regulator
LSSDNRDQLEKQLLGALRLAQSASDAMDSAFAEFVGLNHTDARCLDLIDQSDQITAGDLAKKVGLTTGAVTAVVDRLEAAGLVRRIRDTEDRRKVFIEATEDAKRLGSEVYGPIAQAGLPYLRQLTDQEVSLITDFLEMSARINLEHSANVRRMAGGAKLSLRQRVEQARHIKTEAKTLAKAIKRDLKAMKDDVKGLTSWATDGHRPERVRDSEGEWTDI